MPLNGNIKLDCYRIKKGKDTNSGEELLILKVIITETEGEKRQATVYLGKAEDKERCFVLKGNMHVDPFTGEDALERARRKAENRIRNLKPDEAFTLLARL